MPARGPDPAVLPIPCQPTAAQPVPACPALQITQTPIVLDEFGFTFLDLDTWSKGYEEVITIKQSALNPAKPYQFYQNGLLVSMTAAEQTAAGIKVAVTTGTDSAGDATYTFRSTLARGGENNPTNFADLTTTTPTTTGSLTTTKNGVDTTVTYGGQTEMQQQAIQLNFLGKTSIAVTLAALWPGTTGPVDFSTTEVTQVAANDEKLGKAGTCAACAG